MSTITRPFIIPAALAAMCLASAFPAHADAGTRPGMEISGFAGYRWGGNFKDPVSDERLELDDEGSIGLILNIDHDANTEWEFLFSHQSTRLQPAPLFTGTSRLDVDVSYLSGGGIYVWRDPRVESFLGAGIGVAHFSPQDSRYDSETRALFSLAGGYRFRLTDNIGLRLEARGYYTLLNTNAAVFCGNGGCIARVDSSGLTQVEINAGLSVRF
ncbi:MAG: outer membrane beta-barrel protein [Xanthomonadaceae bacterium]|nr:outer membrane beta-barrel protein [Xanthomonadaceae bacterium]